MELGRKRLRSQEYDSFQQRKMFINQKIVDKNDKYLMKKVYEKTLSLMFKGNQNVHKKQPNDVHETSTDENLDTVDDKFHSTLGCKFCINEVISTNVKYCKNCNLNACERCTVNCIYCSSCLCANCVNIFGCNFLSDDGSVTPMCEDCKKFI